MCVELFVRLRLPSDELKLKKKKKLLQQQQQQ